MQQKARSVALAFNNLPRRHRIMLGTLTAVTLAVAIWRPYMHHQTETTPVAKEAGSNRVGFAVTLPEASEPIDQATPAPEDDIPKDEIDKNSTAESGDYDYVISSGDTLGNILAQYGIDMGEVRALVNADKDLARLNVGQQLTWKLSDDGSLQRLTWGISQRETRVYDRTGSQFKMASALKTGEWQDSVISGTVNNSFVRSAQQAGLTSAEINSVVKALQWQLDFRKLRSDDKFTILLSREMLNGKNQQSQLIGASLSTGGQRYYSIRAEDGKFYDRNGSGLARGFLRFPTIKQFRISSGFNLRRLNPVTGRIAPHKGIDFSMPLGTPVLAVGDGEVLVAKHSGDAGNYVAIRHGRQYMTRYMHMKALLVKPGQKVKRGDRIGLSGNTGRSTGPHLHYEVWVDNKAVNPLTAKLPLTEGLSGKERTVFLQQAKKIIAQMK